ncbi:hypothetical protein CN918_31085 [Priestia megaterium]|nr:hypothetical protein CN918_31085 [Priestia megaterium]
MRKRELIMENMGIQALSDESQQLFFNFLHQATIEIGFGNYGESLGAEDLYLSVANKISQLPMFEPLSDVIESTLKKDAPKYVSTEEEEAEQ